MTRLNPSVLAIAVVSLVAPMLLANRAQATLLVTNGSFEDSANFVSPGNDTMSLAVGSTTMPGWTVAGSESLAWIGSSNPYGLSASAGSYFLDLTGYSIGAPFSGVTQTIATSSGSTYQLSFDLGSSSLYGIPSAITASAAAASQTFTSTLTGTNSWETETLLFTATGATTAISLLGAAGSNYIGLDNVSVAFVSGPGIVPEPAALSLMAVGLFGLGVARRRRA